MRPDVLEYYEGHPEPSIAEVPVGPGQLDRIDDNLHWAWSWHRYRYCYRRAEHLRVLDAGCGTGLSSLGLARLNPGASVVGLDLFQNALDLAARRLEALESELDVTFRRHDLAQRLPGGLGPFDYIVCRGVLDRADDPEAVLRNLAAALDPKGLLLVSVLAPAGRQARRQLRRAIEAIAPPEADLEEKARLGLTLFHSLKLEHPIRRLFVMGVEGGPMTAERLIAQVLGPARRDWDLEGLLEPLQKAGLRFLYVAADHPWQASRTFGEVPEALRKHVESLDDARRSILIDALDPSMHLDQYRVYACLAEHEPILPSWPTDRTKRPEVFDRLVPHPTGLTGPIADAPPGDAVRGSVPYRAINGMAGPIDVLVDARLRLVDGRRDCGEIERLIAQRGGPAETTEAIQARWLELANRGFVLLESSDPRQHVPCIHLGPVRDRLDCPCPRQWVHTCERYGFCTIDPIEPESPSRTAFERAQSRLEVQVKATCMNCADYVSEDPG